MSKLYFIYLCQAILFLNIICAGQNKNYFGYDTEIKEDDHSINKTILLNNQNNFSKILEKLGKSENLRFLNEEEDIYDENDQCKRRGNKYFAELYGFIPVFRGSVKNIDEVARFENSCFSHNELRISEISEEKGSITLEIKSANRNHYLCKDSYFIGTTNIFHVEIVLFEKTNRITFKNLKQDDFEEIKVNGIKVFGFCHGFIRSIFDIIKSANSLLDRTPLFFMEDIIAQLPVQTISFEENKQFLEEYGYIFKNRDNTLLEIDPKFIQSGDLFTSFNLGNVSPLIMWGTGGKVSHNAVAAWIDDELYVLEASFIIEKIKYTDWIKERNSNGQFVALHPLKPEYRQKFIVSKALEFFKQVEGDTYGFSNFLFTGLDRPRHNDPEFLPTEMFSILFAVIEKVSPETSRSLMNEGLQVRLGITDRNMTMHEIAVEAAKRNLTLEELIALPEKDDYIYSSGDNYVCSTMVTKFWKEGGLFDGFEIDSHEFTQKDNYQLKIFEEDSKKLPKTCQEQNPDLTYCILSGQYTIDLEGYNTVTLHHKKSKN